MQHFNAILYGSHLPLTGKSVSAYFTTAQLFIDSDNIQVTADTIEAQVGGFEQNSLFLNWLDNQNNRWGLKPYDNNDIAIVLNTAPPALTAQLAIWQRHKKNIRWVWGSIATFAGVLGLSAILLWWHYDQAISWVVEYVPISKEQEIGQALLKKVQNESDLIEQGIALESVKQIGQNLTQGSRYSYQWFIKKDKTVNAFALPGGIVIVHSALIEKIEHPNELAAVLAHEVQHIERQHALKNLIHNFSWAIILAAALGDIDFATFFVHHIGSMYFSRDVEDEADRLGYQALINAGITPDGMVVFFQRLEKEQDLAPPAWLSSHPATVERIKIIEKLISEQPCGRCQPLQFDWQAIQADKALKT